MKDNRTYGFNKKDAEELIGMIGGGDNTFGKNYTVRRSNGRYAQITDGADGKYSWVSVSISLDSSSELEIVLKPDWGSGSHENEYGYAVDMLYNSKYVIPGSIVELLPCPTNLPFHVFNYQPSHQKVLIPLIESHEMESSVVYQWQEASGGWHTSTIHIDVRNPYDVAIGPALITAEYLQGVWEARLEPDDPPRYVIFRLSADVDGATLANFYELEGGAQGNFIEEATLFCPLGINSTMKANWYGYALKQNGFYYFVQAACDQEEEE